MRCRSFTRFPHCWQLGYSSTSACDGTDALHGPQCLHGSTMYSALCRPQSRHGSSVRAGARPGAGGDAGACQIWLMGLRGGTAGAIGGRNGCGGATDALTASGGQYAPARPGVPAVYGAVISGMITLRAFHLLAESNKSANRCQPCKHHLSMYGARN